MQQESARATSAQEAITNTTANAATIFRIVVPYQLRYAEPAMRPVAYGTFPLNPDQGRDTAVRQLPLELLWLTMGRVARNIVAGCG
jgi:hypothetical protein